MQINTKLIKNVCALGISPLSPTTILSRQQFKFKSLKLAKLCAGPEPWTKPKPHLLVPLCSYPFPPTCSPRGLSLVGSPASEAIRSTPFDVLGM